MNEKNAVKIANITADLMIVIGRMKRSARNAGETGIHPGTEFAILDTIFRHGCRTVPEIAAWRGVARQSVQSVVNKLVEADVVGQLENPEHKLSPILVLRPEGLLHYERVRKQLFEKYRGVEANLLDGDLEAAARVILVIAETWGTDAGDSSLC